MFGRKPLLKNYVSEMDRFLRVCDERPGAHSTARRREESKHQRIARLRDDPKGKHS